MSAGEEERAGSVELREPVSTVLLALLRVRRMTGKKSRYILISPLAFLELKSETSQLGGFQVTMRAPGESVFYNVPILQVIDWTGRKVEIVGD